MNRSADLIFSDSVDSSYGRRCRYFISGSDSGDARQEAKLQQLKKRKKSVFAGSPSSLLWRSFWRSPRPKTFRNPWLDNKTTQNTIRQQFKQTRESFFFAWLCFRCFCCLTNGVWSFLARATARSTVIIVSLEALERDLGRGKPFLPKEEREDK